MKTRLFVAGLEWSIRSEEMKAIFEDFGTVVYSRVVTDENNRSRGFGFIEMGTPEEAEAAIKGLNETEQKGRAIVVKWREENTASRAPRTYNRD